MRNLQRSLSASLAYYRRSKKKLIDAGITDPKERLLGRVNFDQFPIVYFMKTMKEFVLNRPMQF